MLQVIVKGKVRAQRAKAMKFGDGYMVSSGHPAKIYLEKAFTHVQMRQGSIGIKVRAPPRASLISQSSATVIAISCDAVPARCASCCRTTPPARTASRPPSQTSSRSTSLPLSRRRKHVVQFVFCSKIGWFHFRTLRLTIAALELFSLFSRNTIF